MWWLKIPLMMPWAFDILVLQKNGVFDKLPGYQWTCYWKRCGEIVARISYWLEGNTESLPSAIWLSYTVKDMNGEKKAYEYPVQLDYTT